MGVFDLTAIIRIPLTTGFRIFLKFLQSMYFKTHLSRRLPHGVLQLCDELKSVGRDDTVVVIAGRQKHCRILASVLKKILMVIVIRKTIFTFNF